MRASIKILAFLPLSFVVLDAATPEWVVDLKSLGVPGPPPLGSFNDRAWQIGFSASNAVLIDFVLYAGELKSRQPSGEKVRLTALSIP
jgi:hypothetical protein